MNLISQLGSNLRLKLGLAAMMLVVVPNAASADTPAQKWAKARVEQGLVGPLAKKEDERSKYSRARMPPAERRVRILSTQSMKDPHGRSFLSFVIDARYSRGAWDTRIEGCVYKGSGNIYVKSGDAYRSSDFLLGKKAKVIPDVCVSPSAGGQA